MKGGITMAINITSNLQKCSEINQLADCGSLIKQEQEAGFSNISITLNVSQELIDSLTAFDVEYSVNTPTESASETTNETPVVTE